MAYMVELEQNQYEIMTSLHSMNVNIARLQTNIESFDTKLNNLTDSVNNLMINKVDATAADGDGDHQAAVNPEPAVFRLPKINFPRFNGQNQNQNPRAWTNKCEQFFELCPVPETQKVLFASFHLDGRPEIWFRSYYELKLRVLDWPTFVEDICVRFGRSRMEEFRGLRQSTTVLAYLEKFEEQMADVIWEHWFDNEFLVASFVGGLNDGIRFRVQMLRPTTVSDAAYMARIEEAALKPRF